MKKLYKITDEQELLCREIAEKFVSKIKEKTILQEVEEVVYQSMVVAIAYDQLTTAELKSILNMRLEAITLFAMGLAGFVKSLEKQEKEGLSSIH